MAAETYVESFASLRLCQRRIFRIFEFPAKLIPTACNSSTQVLWYRNIALVIFRSSPKYRMEADKTSVHNREEGIR